jgi:hypothetical protein
MGAWPPAATARRARNDATEGKIVTARARQPRNDSVVLGVSVLRLTHRRLRHQNLERQALQSSVGHDEQLIGSGEKRCCRCQYRPVEFVGSRGRKSLLKRFCRRSRRARKAVTSRDNAPAPMERCSSLIWFGRITHSQDSSWSTR